MLRFLDAAAASGQTAQVVALGAGFDTTWFQLTKDGGGTARYRCLEVDFKEVTKRKASIISKEESLKGLLLQQPAAVADGAAGDSGQASSSNSFPISISVEAAEVLSSHYCLLPVDLRDTRALAAAVERAGFSTRNPTYVLSECVLVYMEPQQTAAVVRWAGSTFSNAVMAVYEQIKPDDPFGRQMVSNLEARGCPLQGLAGTPTLEAQCDRLTSNGWQHAEARDMDCVYRDALDPQDKARCERLELFDEFEEWHLIQEHYCIALGRNDAQGWLAGVGFEALVQAARAAGPALGPGFGAPPVAPRAPMAG